MGTRLTLFCAVWLTLGTGCSTLHRSDNAQIQDNTDGALFQKKLAQNQLQVNHANLQTAIKLLSQNKPDEAQLYADKIEPVNLSSNDRAKLNLAYAQIHLSHAETEPALNRLHSVQYALLAPEEQIIYLRSKAFASSLAGKLIDSAKARIALQALLKDPHQQYDNKLVTLDTLRLLPDDTLQIKQPPAPNILGGWMALARLLKSKPQLDINDPDLIQWRTGFPKHPANGAFLTAYLISFQGVPQTIALMLPESGPYAQAAKAIKDGFLAASNADEQTTYQPHILYFDTSGGDPVSLYKQAVDQGAQLVIGPLNKEHVQQLALNANLEIPALTLNYIPGLNKINLYQFALSPIDDAEEVTRRAAQDGYKRVALLTPTSELGERMQGYFKTALKNTDGKLLKAKSYDPEAQDYGDTLKDLLNFNETEQRFTRLNKLIPDLHYTPRRRQDIEAVFMTAYPQNAHLIQFKLKSLGFGNIPLYATSHIYNGVTNPSDNDLDGITFCDIPWLFNASYPGNLSQEALRGIWQDFPEVYLRLIAMGIDAYNLAAHLSKLGNLGYQGASGNLLLTDENRIQRQLVCAKFKHNQPQLLRIRQNDFNTITTPDSATDESIDNSSVR